ncbi:MAG: 16S rRNA processing protein RimM [Bacteroidetes bacterium]|nr:16S rRNA processing protein RimM [Bacteroidota bacterium]
MEYLATGVIRTSHGLKGFVKVHIFSDTHAYLKKIKHVVLKKDSIEKQVEIEELQMSGGQVLIKFSSVNTPEEARKFNGWEVCIPREYCPALEEDEFYQADIVGCSVYFNGNKIGDIVSVLDGAQAPLIEIKTESGKNLVPFLEQYIGLVSIPEKRVELKVDWILV